MAFAQWDQIDRLWMARGMQAIDKSLKMLEEIPQEKKGKKKSTGELLGPKQRCEFMLESSYSAFANPDLKDIVKKPHSGMMSYRMSFVDGDIVAQLYFLYKAGKQTPSHVHVARLTGDWTAMVAMEEETVLIGGSGCIFGFSLSAPLDGVASPTQ